MPRILDIEPPPGCLVRFISDLHFGHRRSMAPSPARLLEQMQGVGMLVLCGDTAETRFSGCSAGFALRDELRRLCRDRAIALVELAGNHDTDIEPMLARFWGGSVAATHGHALLQMVSPWSHEYLAAKRHFRALAAAHPEAGHNLDARLELAAHIASELAQRTPTTASAPERRSLLHKLHHYCWPPERPLSIFWNWLTISRRAERWMRSYLPGTSTLILGHFHRPFCRRSSGRAIYNTGAWFQHARPYAVDFCDAHFISFRELLSSP